MLDLIRKESLQAEGAIEAILRSTQSPQVTKRLEELVAGNRRLSHALAKAKLNK